MTPALQVIRPVRALDIHLIYANPDQPRKIFKTGPLQELANSIQQVGVMQPITVVPRKCALGDWMIVQGERRFRASKLAALTTIQAIVREDLSDKDVAELALIENLLREDLNILEEARAYAGFLARGYTVESLSTMLGFNQSWRITERTNVLKLDPSLQAGLQKGAISPSQAQEMSRLSIEGQFRLWRAIQDGKCESYAKLTRLSAAILEQEQQSDLFQKEELTAEDKKAIEKVDVFINQCGRLISMITAEDLSIMERVVKSNAQACADQLALLEKLCRQTKNALLTNVSKQEALCA